MLLYYFFVLSIQVNALAVANEINRIVRKLKTLEHTILTTAVAVKVGLELSCPTPDDKRRKG